ncbi:MAG TPA: fumarylacetoacetate hydrolase family protein [Acidothermaceae bacterium]|nr:fumarylacetoacetate hydrolase family protein [Acidothermaceae bacterium]
MPTDSLRCVRIARFSYGDQASSGFAFGAIEGDEIAVIDGHPFGQPVRTGQRVPVAGVRLLPPILPSKIVAIGKNYADHAREMGGEPPAEPVLFLKPSTSVIGPGSGIVYPPLSQQVDYEGEVAVVIGRLCREVPLERALEVVLGYTCANDVTARDLQRADGQWARAKGFDTFCPLGPWIETDLDPSDLAITTSVNGTVKQDARTSLLLHDVGELISFVSNAMTLLPGDVILTGTPAGVGPVVAGDEVSVTVEGIGTLTNTVVTR